MDKNTDTIQVMVRVRPLNDREKREGAKSCIILDEDNPKSITIDTKPEQKSFKFDYVGGDNTTQEDIFQIAARPLMMAALEGYNACIFAYGQTGAGKTFTMQGRGLEEDRDSKERGVQPRVFDHLFALTNDQKKEGNVEYLVKCSYLEIYNEQIMDLLSNTQSNLMVREDLKKGVYIEGLTEEIAKSSDETIQLLLKGMRNRHVGATNMNFESSRSHSVFSMTIESKKTQEGMVNVKASKLHFVDLAGSERQKQTAAAGDRLKEASNINKSLTTLGLVINSLVEQAQGRNRHIPYRDSKLTFLLKDSLGGNSRTYMVAAVSAASTSFQETLSTLQFAQRAKMIKNKASINEEAQGNVESLKKEIKRLKEDLLATKAFASQLEDQLKNTHLSQGAQDMEIEDDINIENIEGLIEEEEITGQTQKKKKQVQNIFTEEQVKEVIAINTKCLEMEEEVQKQIISIQQGIEEQIVPEIVKKDVYLQSYQSGVALQDQCETHQKNILRLFQQRINKLNKLLSQKIDQEELKIITSENQELMNEQYEELLKLMSETPNIMNVFDENVNLKIKLEKYESNPESMQDDSRSMEQVLKSIEQIVSLSEALSKSIDDRKFVKEKLEKLQLSKVSSNEQIRMVEDRMHNLKIEHNDLVQTLNFDLTNSKQREHAQERVLEQERNKVIQLKQEIIKLKEQKAKDFQNQQEEIEELLNQFNQIDDQKNQATDEYEQSINQLNRRILELDTKLSTQKQQVSELQTDLLAKEVDFNNEREIKERLQNELNEKTETFGQENRDLENKIVSYKSKMNQIQEELDILNETNTNLKTRVQQLELQEENHLATLASISKDKAEELKKISTQLNEKQDEMIHLQQQLEAESQKVEQFETEKNKIQDELGVLNETYNYQQQEFTEQKTLIEQLQESISAKDKEISELKLRVENSSQNIKSPNSHQASNSSTTNSANSETNLNASTITVENDSGPKFSSSLSEQNHQLRLQVEFESNQNISLRSQMNSLSNKVNELQQSEKHFRAAYIEVRGQLQQISQRNKDLQQALQTKEMEQYEAQRDIKNANENAQNLQDRIQTAKGEMKTKEKDLVEADNKLKKCKEAIIKLQESLRQKMDNLQQALVKNGELETKMALHQREMQSLKTDLKGKSSLSEKRVQELLKSFSQQRIETLQMQKIINAKIEENIALTASVRLLQNLIEKYNANEYELQLQLKQQNEKEVLYKKRIDTLIQDYGKLEQEQVYSGQNEELFEVKGLLENKIKEADNVIRQKDIMAKGYCREKEILQVENEKLDKQIYELKQGQSYILKEKDQIINQLQSSVLEKEKELKEVQSKIAQIQIGIQQAQQYFNKYQSVAEENRKMKADIDLRDHQLKSIEQQMKAKANEALLSASKSNSANDKKYKEKLVILDEKYQNLKIKYMQIQQLLEETRNSHSNKQDKEEISSLNLELSTLQQHNQKIHEDHQKLINQVSSFLSVGENDLSPEISQRIQQLCEFVLQQLTQTSKELDNNLPDVSCEVGQNIMFLVHSFNNLFESIKKKESSLQHLRSNETKQNKKVSSLEKEVLLLKKKLSTTQPSTACSSGAPTPKSSVVNSVYKTPGSTLYQQPSNQNPLNNLLISGNSYIHPQNQISLPSNNNSLNNSFSVRNSSTIKLNGNNPSRDMINSSLNRSMVNSSIHSVNNDSSSCKVSINKINNNVNPNNISNSSINSNSSNNNGGTEEIVKKKIKV